MKKYILGLATAIVLFFGCKEDNELKESIMVYDSEDTELPTYSEWGYNTFGAYFDRETFISDNQRVPLKVIVSNNETSFIFSGHKGNDNSYYENGNDNKMTMTLILNDFKPAKYQDLLAFNDTTLDLTKSTYKVVLTINNVRDTMDILEGKFIFKRAQNLFVDDKQIEVILSGYFGFKAVIKGVPMTLSDGRFDMGIDRDNFYYYVK
jgi:hypothetical protein